MPWHRQFLNYVKFLKDLKVHIYHGYNYVKIIPHLPSKTFFLC